MAIVGTLGDMIDHFPAPVIMEAANNFVTINGTLIITDGSQVAPHPGPDKPHEFGIMVAGQAYITINGSPIVRLGDICICPGIPGALARCKQSFVTIS